MAGGEKLPIIIPLLEEKETAPIDELDDQILLLEAARHRLDVEWTELVGVFEEREGHRVHGYPSMVAYLKHRARMAASRANRYVSIARAARKFRATLASWKYRQISTDQAELLFKASDRMPDEYPDAEATLLEVAGDSVEETKRILEYWRNRVDRPGIEADIEVQMDRRRLDWTWRANGMIEGEFALTSLAGEGLITALDALTPPLANGDRRTPSQRRHDALEDLAYGYLEGADTPDVGGEKPHVTVFVDSESLEGIPGGLHETESGHVLNVDTIRQLSCDSSITRLVWKGKSEVLDVGRRTRIIPTALRRAVIARDRHCVWKGCSRSPRWCDVHHLVSWADGGETKLSNLVLLCRYHHTLVHTEEWDSADLRVLDVLEPAGLRST